jgi:hypothetical protein
MFPGQKIHDSACLPAPSITPNTDEQTLPQGRATHNLIFGRNEMKTILAAITFALFSVIAVADPCMDANVSPLGYSLNGSADEIHLSEHGC